MSAQLPPIQKRYSSKKKVDSSINISNNFDYGRIPRQTNENENHEIIEAAYRPSSIHSSGKEGLEDYVLAKLKTLSSHFSDNPEIPNIVTIIKKGRRKERLNQLDSLSKERRTKQKQRQQSSTPHYLENINDDDLLIKAQERLRFKHNAYDSKRNKGVKIQDYRESDGDQGIGMNQVKPVQMDDYTANQKDFDTNRQPLDRLPRSQSQPSPKILTAPTPQPPPNIMTRVVDNNIGTYRSQENKRTVPKSKKYDSRDIYSYMNYKAKLQDKARRKQEFELIRKQVIKEETNRRLRQLEEFRRKQRKEKMAQLAQQETKNRELKLNEDVIDDEYKEIMKQQRRERMAEIARESRESRNPSINGSQEQDNENTEYWEHLTPDSIGWKDFLSITKENDKSQFSCWTLNTADRPDKCQENISKALEPEQSFKQILKERYILQPAIGKHEQTKEEKDQVESLLHPTENEYKQAKSVGVQIPKDSKSAPDQKILFNQSKLRQKIQEENPISKPLLKPTQHLRLENTLSKQNDIPQSIAKVQGWLEHSEGFDELDKIENGTKIPSSNNTDEDYSSSENFSSDNETSTMRNSKSLLALLSKIRSTKKKINSRDKVSLERQQRTLEVMQRIVTDLIEKHEEIAERDRKMEDGKKHVRELLNAITGKNTRDIVDALSQSLDNPPNDFDVTSDSLDALLKQLRKATEGLKNVEGQLTRKEKRLKTAIEIAQDLVDKRLNLINWERRLRKHEQCVNEIASHIGESKDSSVNQQNDGSGYIGSVLGSFFGKKDSENKKNQGQERTKTREKVSNSAHSKSHELQQVVYTEEDWEKILVPLAPESEPVSSNAPSVDDDKSDWHIDNGVGNSKYARNSQQKQNADEYLNMAQDAEGDTTIQSSSDVNQISKMDEYLLLLARQERMKEYLDKIGDNQQSIKNYLSKVEDNDNDSSAINSEYFRTNIPIEEITRAEIKEDAPAENKFDKGKGKQVNNFTSAIPTFDHLTNENLLETEPSMEDSDSDWEELTSRFNGLSFSRNIVKPKSTNRISKRRIVKDKATSTSLNKFPKKVPTTERLVRNADWEKLLLKIQSKSHLQKTPSWLQYQDNKANTSSSNFFVNTEGKLGGIFANISQTSSTEAVKDFKNDEIPKVQVIDDVGTELKSDLTIMGPVITNQKDILASGKSGSLNLGDYLSRSFPVPVIPQQIPEKIQKEDIRKQELEIPKYNLEKKHQEKEKDISTNNVKDKEEGKNVDDGGMIAESGLDFSEVVNNLPGWKSFVSLVRGNVDKKNKK